MPMNLHQVMVRRDKFTEFPKTVPAHEIKVLQFLFGEENVQVEAKNVRTADIDPAGEQERLSQCYGKNVIAEVFGREPGRIRELAEREMVGDDDAPKAARGKKAAGKKEGDAPADGGEQSANAAE